jgi:hypothetical protein
MVGHVAGDWGRVHWRAEFDVCDSAWNGGLGGAHASKGVGASALAGMQHSRRAADAKPLPACTAQGPAQVKMRQNREANKPGAALPHH